MNGIEFVSNSIGILVFLVGVGLFFYAALYQRAAAQAQSIPTWVIDGLCIKAETLESALAKYPMLARQSGREIKRNPPIKVI